MRHLIHSTYGFGAALLLGGAACSNASEGVDTAASTTNPTGADATVVYRDLTAYEISICWKNGDGSIGFAEGGSRPEPGAVLGSVRLYVPFDLDGTRLADLETFTRCSLNE